MSTSQGRDALPADLIARLEGATEGSETDVVREALRFALDRGWINTAAYRRAQEMCNAGAFLDAALTLVPDTTDFTIRRVWCVERSARITDGKSVWYGQAPTEALALVIAALRARSAS